MIRKLFWYSTLISLVLSLPLIWLLLRKPSLPPAQTSADAARSFNEKMSQLSAAHEQGMPAEIRLTAAEINSQIQEGLTSQPPPAGPATLKDATVFLEGEKLVAVLAATVKGVKLYVTIGGNLNFSNHTVRLVPSELRVGSLPVPVSWLEGKIDMHMSVPEAIAGVRIENSRMVVQGQ